MSADFMETALRRHNETVGWDDTLLYSALCRASREILDFRIPTRFTLSLGKSVSPQLKSSFSFGLPDMRSAAFLFTSTPLHLPSNSDVEDVDLSISGVSETMNETHSVVELHTAKQPDEPRPTPSKPSSFRWTPTGEYLLYGRLFQDAKLEALYSHKLSATSMFIASGINSWHNDDESLFQAQVAHNGKSWSSQLSYSSDDHIYGLNTLYKFSHSNWVAGGEVYYTAKENSGGLSVGASYNKSVDGVVSILTFVTNPMMGHLSTTHTTTVYPNLNMATRYDFNMYSYESDLAIGAAYCSVDKSKAIRARFSLREGLALMLEGTYKRAVFGLGIYTGFGRRPASSIGVEIKLA